MECIVVVYSIWFHLMIVIETEIWRNIWVVPLRVTYLDYLYVVWRVVESVVGDGGNVGA